MDWDRLPDNVPEEFFGYEEDSREIADEKFSMEEIENIRRYLIKYTSILLAVTVVYIAAVLFFILAEVVDLSISKVSTIVGFGLKGLQLPRAISLMLVIVFVIAGLLIAFLLFRRISDWVRFAYLISGRM